MANRRRPRIVELSTSSSSDALSQASSAPTPSQLVTPHTHFAPNKKQVKSSIIIENPQNSNAGTPDSGLSGEVPLFLQGSSVTARTMSQIVNTDDDDHAEVVEQEGWMLEVNGLSAQISATADPDAVEPRKRRRTEGVSHIHP